MAKTTTARILVDQEVDGIPYKVDELVEFDAGLAKTLSENGGADCHPDAVAYGKKNGAEPRIHVNPDKLKKSNDPEPILESE